MMTDDYVAMMTDGARPCHPPEVPPCHGGSVHDQHLLVVVIVRKEKAQGHVHTKDEQQDVLNPRIRAVKGPARG